MLGQSLKNAQEQKIPIFEEVNAHHFRVIWGGVSLQWI